MDIEGVVMHCQPTLFLKRSCTQPHSPNIIIDWLLLRLVFVVLFNLNDIDCDCFNVDKLAEILMMDI